MKPGGNLAKNKSPEHLWVIYKQAHEMVSYQTGTAKR